MAITYVNSASAVGTGTSLAVALNFANAGSFLVSATNGSTALTNFTVDNSDAIQSAVAITTNNIYLSIYYAENANSGNTTVTRSSGSSVAMSISIAEFTGIATSGSEDQTNTGTGYGTAATTANVTTTLADELIICATGASGTPTYTAGANYTERQDTGGAVRGHELENRIVTGTGTYAGASTLSGANDWNCLIATFKMAASTALSIFQSECVGANGNLS
jgi:hypothetical protein